MKRLLRTILPKRALAYLSLRRAQLLHLYANESYSQEGEDIVLDRFLEGRPSGFYVDVGAHHPMHFSNTYRFYRRGWRGLNIDANPGCMKKFDLVRPRDINVEAGVSLTPQTLTYHIFNAPLLNTFDKELARKHSGGQFFVVKEVEVPTLPLHRLLDKYVPPGTRIDLLTVDVEGFDYQVLQSNDWTRYTPEFILIEALGLPNLEASASTPIALLLADKGYAKVAKTMNTIIFRHRDAIKT